MIQIKKDIVIVGGGPVGLALSIALAQAGLSVAVIERHEAIQQLPKAQGLNEATLDFMRDLGVDEAIRQGIKVPNSIPNMRIRFLGGLAGRMHPTAIEPRTPSSSIRVPLWHTQQVLLERAIGLGVAVYSGYAALAGSLMQSEAGVRIIAANATEQNEFEGCYLVACDGARSTVRESLGIALEHHKRLGKMLTAQFHAPDLDNMIACEEKDRSVLNMFVNGDYVGAFGRIDGEGHWYAHMGLDGTPYADTTFSASSVLDVFSVASGLSLRESNCTLSDYAVWENRQGIAEHYRERRVLMAGDAAHSMSPTGGHGLNTGFQDARVLATKLIRVLLDAEPETVLDEYEQEQRPLALDKIAISKANLDRFRQVESAGEAGAIGPIPSV